MRDVRIIWDLEDDRKGNYWYIVVEGHGVTAEEVDEVLSAYDSETTTSRSSGNPIAFGWTSQGQYIAVLYEHIDDDPLTLYPINAYPTTPPKRKKHAR